MKHTHALLLSLSLALPLSLHADGVANSTDFEVTEGTFFYSSASLDSRQKERIVPGDKVQLVDAVGVFSKIRYSGSKEYDVYIPTDKLNVKPSENDLINEDYKTPLSGKAANAYRVYFYSDADMGTVTESYILTDDPLSIHEKRNGFYRISYESATAGLMENNWVKVGFVAVNGGAKQ